MYISCFKILHNFFIYRRTDGQTYGLFESCSEFDYKHNGMKIFSSAFLQGYNKICVLSFIFEYVKEYCYTI